jgi:MFS family permease
MRFLRERSTTPREPLHLNAMLAALRRAYRGIPALVRQMPAALRALSLVIIFSFTAQSLVGSFWVVYAVDRIGLSADQWGLILLVEAVVRVVLFLPAGMLADRWGRTVTLVAALVLTVVATPLFVILRGFFAILLVRMALAITFDLGLAACIALMADLVPRASRGQMMAAIGQGGIMLGAAGNPGGPSVGYLTIPAVMVAALAGGFLYAINPAYPWIAATAAGLLAVLLAVGFVRDPREAEV